MDSCAGFPVSRANGAEEFARNFLGMLAPPREIAEWSLTSLRET